MGETIDRLENLAPDEKATPVMIHTLDAFYWGTVVTKEMIRVGAWLRTNMAPTYVNLMGAQRLPLVPTKGRAPQAIPQIFIPATDIVAFHVAPSYKEPSYYDPEEPNRKLEPVTIFRGQFRIRAHLHLAIKSTVEKFLDVTQESFIPVFGVIIGHPLLPPPGAIKLPYAVIRRQGSIVASGHH